MTDLWGGCPLQNDFRNTLCEMKSSRNHFPEHSPPELHPRDVRVLSRVGQTRAPHPTFLSSSTSPPWRCIPPSSEFGAYEAVTDRFWRWVSAIKLFSPGSEAAHHPHVPDHQPYSFNLRTQNPGPIPKPRIATTNHQTPNPESEILPFVLEGLAHIPPPLHIPDPILNPKPPPPRRRLRPRVFLRRWL